MIRVVVILCASVAAAAEHWLEMVCWVWFNMTSFSLSFDVLVTSVALGSVFNTREWIPVAWGWLVLRGIFFVDFLLVEFGTAGTGIRVRVLADNFPATLFVFKLHLTRDEKRLQTLRGREVDSLSSVYLYFGHWLLPILHTRHCLFPVNYPFLLGLFAVVGTLRFLDCSFNLGSVCFHKLIYTQQEVFAFSLHEVYKLVLPPPFVIVKFL